MKKQGYYIFITVIWLLAGLSCRQPSAVPETDSGSHIPVHYAKGFTIHDHQDYLIVNVRDPLDTTHIIETYCLVRAGKNTPERLQTTQIINIPIKNIACLSTTHLGFIEALDLRDKVTGIAGTKYVFDAALNQRINSGAIKEIGNEASLNYELLVSMHPDMVMTYVLGADGKEQLNKMRSLQMQPVINNEYLELTPLGQAEWIKFVAAFFDNIEKAEQVFADVEKQYNETVALIKTEKTKPTVLTGLPFRGEWTVPGGKSFAATYLSDAGGDFLWSDNTSTGNIPVSMEQVIARAMNADCWINIGAEENASSIPVADHKLSEFTAYKTGNLFNNNNRVNANGGNDYWESGIVNPQVVLQDLAKIFHPSFMQEHQFYYYKHLD